MESVVHIEHLSKVYVRGEEKQVVLDDLSVEFPFGQFTSIRGRSGSGKSTLLNLIAGIDEATAGQIAIGDQKISQMSPRERAHFRRDNIGFVFQFFNLIPTLTVIENVSLPSELSGRSEAESNERAARLIDQVGLRGREADFPDVLSGGEQQRVAIARAVAKRPDVLLCDEPTGALDYRTGIRVLEVLRDVNRALKTTLVLITHNAAIADMAHRVLRMRSGRIVEIRENDTPKEPDTIAW